MSGTGVTVWLTGLPSAGKTTLARAVAARLVAEGHPRVEVLDGDEMRRTLTKELGFSPADRIENIRRIGAVAHLLARNHVIVLCAVVSPYRAARDAVRALHEGRFVEVHVAAPVEVCAARDVKQLYARHRAGELEGLTGVDAPYEPPTAPEVEVCTDVLSVDEATVVILDALRPVLGGARALPNAQAAASW